MTGRVLVVEDNEAERKALVSILKSEGLTVSSAENVDKALGYLDENPDVVLTDLRLGGRGDIDRGGIDLMGAWKHQLADTQFIILTGYSSVNGAVEAIKAGAFDYLTKPVNTEELMVSLRLAMESQRRDRELQSLRKRVDQKFGLDKLVGESRQMKEVVSRVQRAAPFDSTVLILGESGTGKDLVAQALHNQSLRKNGPFVAVNCAAVPATLVESELFGHVRGAFTGATDRRVGRFEQAIGGTLFIDEIGDFELGLQAKLLRVLETLTLTPVGGQEEHRVDVRVVAATSRDIRKMVADGTFREDLFYRLNVLSITLPPLRERPGDIPILVQHFLSEISQQQQVVARRISRPVMERFKTYLWPGNVRELRNTLESILVMADSEEITEADLPERLAAGNTSSASTVNFPTDLTLDQLERLAIAKALELCNDNRTHAANRLGISVRTLQRKLRQYEREQQTNSAIHDILSKT